MKDLEKIAKDLWKEVCYKEHGGICECCGKVASTFHHFIPKSISNNLRYDIKNGVPVCRKCHYSIHFSHDTLKRRSLENTIIAKRGKKWLKYITEARNTLIKKNKTWLTEQIERLECY